MLTLLHVEDDRAQAAEMREEVLARFGDRLRVVHAPDGETARERLASARPDLVLLDLSFPRTRGGTASDTAGEELLRAIEELRPEPWVVVASGQQKEVAIALLIGHRAIRDFIFKDASYDEMYARLRKQVDLLEELRALRDRPATALIGDGPAMQRVKKIVAKVAPEKASVLILGESGTGKELVARTLHEQSPRAAGPFVKVNCAAFAENILESELFGHVKGAFTGAESAREGRFEAADGGTLFLDEIGDVSLATQVKLLRFLQEREFEPVGSSRTRKVDVRLVCATNRDLEAAVKSGAFREDFYYRIRVFPVRVPSLRDRREDLPALIAHFLAKMNADRVHQVAGVSEAARRRLAAHDWPGNVRELEHVLQHAAILADGPELQESDLLLGPAPAAEEPSGGHLAETLLATERRLVVEAFERNAGDLDRTAADLGIEKRTLHKKLNLHRISRQRKKFDA